MQQFVLTPAAGKRLIGKAMAAHPSVQRTMRKGTLVIVAGTTNAYVAQEVLAASGQLEGFSFKGFHRGWTVGPLTDAASVAAPLTGDVILVDGVWQRGKQIFDFADGMGESDLILKGANALDVARRQAAVQIGHPQCGTAAAALRAAVGRRVELIAPVGLEKRVAGDLHDIALRANAPGGAGPRLLVLPAAAFCELDAVKLLTGASAEMVAAGGVWGAEGCVWLGVTGTAGELAAATELLNSVAKEPPTEA